MSVKVICSNCGVKTEVVENFICPKCNSVNKEVQISLDRLEEILRSVPWAGAACLKLEALRLIEKSKNIVKTKKIN